MTSQEIETRLLELTRSERKITAEIVTLIREADRRRLYLERGFPSLFDWLVGKFGYSHSAAYRRIQASRLQKDLPGLPEKIRDGSVNLTTLAQVQTAVRNHERKGAKLSAQQKHELVAQIENKTSAETQQILAECLPGSTTPKESLRHISKEESSMTVVLSNEERTILEKVKQLMAHTNPNATWAEVIAYAGRFVLKAKSKAPSTRFDAVTAAQSAKSKAQIRREILARGCEFKDPLTKRRCGSKFQIEVDHIQPRAMGGSDDPSNLRCLCRKHNLLMAERRFGKEKMRKYWRPG